MNKNLLSAFLTALLLTSILLLTAQGKNGMDKVLAMAFVMIGLLIAASVVAVGFRMSAKTKPYTTGIWLGLGVSLLIGFAVCTT